MKHSLFNMETFFAVKIFNSVKKFFLLKILKRKYYKTGTCKGCGKCCENIYVNHGNKGFIKTKEEFDRLKPFHSFYRGLEYIGEDEMGVLFKCTHLDLITRKCKIHFFRPPVCRKYPMEEIFKMGGILSPDCGYQFKPIERFNDILNNLSK